MLVVALVVTVGLYSPSFGAYESYIEVTGKGECMVAPDRFEVQIVIDEATTKGKVTVKELESDMVKMLKSLGVDCEKSLSIKYVSSEYLSRKGALAKATYLLKLEDGELVQSVYGKLSDLDIRSVKLLSSYNSKQDEYEEKARNEALQSARATAESMAMVYNQWIGACFFMSYNISYANRTFDSDVVMVGYGAQSKRELTGALNSTPLSFEKQKITARVTVKFLLLTVEPTELR